MSLFEPQHMRPRVVAILLDDSANRYCVTLTAEGRGMLEAITRSGKTSSPKFIHARALLLCDAGDENPAEPWKVADVAEARGLTP